MSSHYSCPNEIITLYGQFADSIDVGWPFGTLSPLVYFGGQTITPLPSSNDTSLQLSLPLGTGDVNLYVYLLLTGFDNDTVYYISSNSVTYSYKDVTIDSVSRTAFSCFQDTINLYGAFCETLGVLDMWGTPFEPSVSVCGMNATILSISDTLIRCLEPIQDTVPLEGDINPEGGDKSNVSQQLEIDDTKTSDKHPSLIKLEVSDKMGSPDETIKPSLGARIRDTLKSAKSRIRKERVAKVTPKPTARSKELLKKIQFTHDDSGIIQSEGSEDITVTVVSKGVYNNEERTAKQTYLGVADQQEELIKDAINDNETAIAAVFAEAFPDDSVAGTPAPEKTNPGYPFSEPYYSEEPFGSYANRADARAALAAAFGYSEGYTAYKNNFDTQQRKDHWDSSPDLW